MYITKANDATVDPARSVMGAFDSDKYVLADLEQEDRWITVDRTVAVDLRDRR
ncbi:DUF7556 family protein [Natrinema pellirubrum]